MEYEDRYVFEDLQSDVNKFDNSRKDRLYKAAKEKFGLPYKEVLNSINTNNSYCDENLGILQNIVLEIGKCYYCKRCYSLVQINSEDNYTKCEKCGDIIERKDLISRLFGENI